MAPELDYPCADVLVLREAAQYRALGHVVRHRILGLLGERAATTTQLARALGILKGSASFHLRVLEEAGLVRPVRTGVVRGGAERYYGRTARRFEAGEGDTDGSRVLLRNALAELEGVEPEHRGVVAVSRARLRPDQVEEFRSRLLELLAEFRADPAADQPMWALTLAMYPTGLPPLDEPR